MTDAFMNTYSSKSVAVRGAKRANLDDGSFTVEQNNDGRFVIVPVKVEAPATKPEKKARTPRVGPSYKELARNSERSSVTGPVAFVHAWLNANGANVTRKAAVATLVSRGVNYSTARTQYQRWSELRREMASEGDTKH